MTGLGVSKGVAIAKATIYVKKQIPFPQYSPYDAKTEESRYRSAMAAFTRETDMLASYLRENAGETESALLEAQKLIAADPQIVQSILSSIREFITTAEFAISDSMDSYTEGLALMKAEPSHPLEQDLLDIRDRLIAILSGKRSRVLQNLPFPCILVSHSLSASDLALLDKGKVLGLLTESGDAATQTAILARGLSIPAVVAAEGALDIVKSGDILAINGTTGEIFVNPTVKERETLEKEQDILIGGGHEYDLYRQRPSLTMDGLQLELLATIDAAPALESIAQNAADGIGLYQTEGLFDGRAKAPGETEQFKTYRQIVEAMSGKPVTFRTLDANSQSNMPFLALERENNPALGRRGLRLSLAQPDLLVTQLRALLRASAYGPVRILLPTVSTLEELYRAKELLLLAKSDLAKRNTEFDGNVPLGIMVETPSACLITSDLAQECEFFYIHTDALAAYTMACDPGCGDAPQFLSPFMPSMIRMIIYVTRNAKQYGAIAGVCGSAAYIPAMIPFWLACGIEEYSMPPAAVLPVRKRIGNLDAGLLRTKLGEIMGLRTEAEVREYLEQLLG